MGLEENVEQWLFSVALRKVAVALGKGAASLVAGAIVQKYMTQYGIQADPEKLQVAATAGVYGAIEAAHDYLKLRFPNVIKW